MLSEVIVSEVKERKRMLKMLEPCLGYKPSAKECGTMCYGVL